MVAPPEERRASPRFRVTLTAHCRIGHRFVRNFVADLCRDGLYLQTQEPVRAGMPVRVALVLPGHEGPEFCSLSGTIARVDVDAGGQTLGVAVRFEAAQIAQADRALLDGFLLRTPA